MVDYLPAPPRPDSFEQGILARVDALAGKPEKLAAFLNGLILDGTAQRPALQSGLAPYLRLPAGAAKRHTRARMAAVIERAMSANNCVTDQDLAEFDAAEIREHLSAAKRIARVAEMAV